MNEFKYRFRINYQNENLKKTSQILEKLDLGIDHLAIEETWELTTSMPRNVNDLKDKLLWVIEQSGGTVFKIEGGRWE